MGRGQLTGEIQVEAVAFLGREITQAELRLYPYLDYVMKNEQKIRPIHINGEERQIIKKLRDEGHIKGGASGMLMTFEFYCFINRVLWHGYVVGGAKFWNDVVDTGIGLGLEENDLQELSRKRNLKVEGNQNETVKRHRRN